MYCGAERSWWRGFVEASSTYSENDMTRRFWTKSSRICSPSALSSSRMGAMSERVRSLHLHVEGQLLLFGVAGGLGADGELDLAGERLVAGGGGGEVDGPLHRFVAEGDRVLLALLRLGHLGTGGRGDRELVGELVVQVPALLGGDLEG